MRVASNLDTIRSYLQQGLPLLYRLLEGMTAEGNFVYRTIDDLEAIEAYAENCSTGVVIGGGLLGLECANALKNLGLKTHVVEFAPRLMPRQLDDIGAMTLRNHIEALDIDVHTSKATTEIVSENGKTTHLDFADGTSLSKRIWLFSRQGFVRVMNWQEQAD